MSDIQLGVYKHYKGEPYEVIGIFLHEETHEPYVAYQSLDGKKRWIRKQSIFCETVTYNGISMPRFELLEPKKTS